MLKKTITYTDFNGNEVSEDHYFHLSKAELVEMEMSQEGGLHDYLQKIIDDNNGKEIIATFKKLLLQAHGKISDDGRRFIKGSLDNDAYFEETEAYSQLFMELVTDANAAAEFVNGIVPQGLDKEMQKLASAPNTEVEDVIKLSKPRVLTRAELHEMGALELTQLLAQGATFEK